jgi:excisionase family DNA binding protein
MRRRSNHRRGGKKGFAARPQNAIQPSSDKWRPAIGRQKTKSGARETELLHSTEPRAPRQSQSRAPHVPQENSQYRPRAKPLAVTVSRACALVGVGRTKMYELIASGRVRSVKIDARRLVDYESLEVLLSSNAEQLHRADDA